MEELAKLIMARYYLANSLEITDLDTSEKEVELFENALKEVGSVSKLKAALDGYIKEHDWTDCLGESGSGNRERSLAIEGCIEYAEPSVRHHVNDDDYVGDAFFESIYREAVPLGWAVLVDDKVWDNGLTEDRANKIAKWLDGKGKFDKIKVISPKSQDRLGADLKNWTFDEKKAVGF